MTWTVSIMTALCLIATCMGMCFFEGNFVRLLLKVTGVVIWVLATFGWWFYPLIDKFVK